jgi:hypothetical protein
MRREGGGEIAARRSSKVVPFGPCNSRRMARTPDLQGLRPYRLVRDKAGTLLITA